MNSALKFTQATSIILIPTSTMLDPTCGSGSAVRAAEITRGEVAFPRYGCDRKSARTVSRGRYGC